MRSYRPIPPHLRLPKLRAIESTTSTPAEQQQLLVELLQQNHHLEDKLVSNTHSFKDVLIYCKKTIEKQDEQIKRLDGIVEQSEIVYEEKLKKERLKAQENHEVLKLTVDKLNSENLLMKTQLGNQDQVDLEINDMRQKLDLMCKELERKGEKIGRKELKERELIIMTTDKVRKELETEFAEEIKKIKKELEIQNLAQVQANQQIVKKVQNDLAKKEKEKESYKMEAFKAQAEIESCQRSLHQYENEKRKFEVIVAKCKLQSEKLLIDSRRQLEEVEETRNKEENRFNEIITAIKKENTDLKKQVVETVKELAEIKQNFNYLKKEKEKSVEKHRNQNIKLGELRQFLKYVLEEKSDKYIDSVIGEDRNAIFTKLLLLLNNIASV